MQDEDSADEEDQIVLRGKKSTEYAQRFYDYD